MYPERDAASIGAWLTARGLPNVAPDPADLPHCSATMPTSAWSDDGG